MRRHLTVAVMAALLLSPQVLSPAGAADPAAAAPGFGAGSHPVLFVHGYNGSAANWDTMAGRFRADGWPASHLDQWAYDSRQSNATTAERLSVEVDRLLAATGASKVDVVTHSMGGLSSRHYAKNLGGDARIDAWVSLGGPNHGTDWANNCFDTSCYEMRAGSAFLTALNSGDETPGAPRYATWWSPCDTIINPDSSVALSGATNTQTSCLSHNGLLTDATVYAKVRDTINR
ncbi:esterase/lipase family protein [Streptomyces sp. NPDC016309]|uniref:esterase/lipase family protein n=1 Tax=Streptomyces sp. NPDC016309 TaxID=3364965 RepID=UPI0037036D4D